MVVKSKSLCATLLLFAAVVARQGNESSPTELTYLRTDEGERLTPFMVNMSRAIDKIDQMHAWLQLQQGKGSILSDSQTSEEFQILMNTTAALEALEKRLESMERNTIADLKSLGRDITQVRDSSNDSASRLAELEVLTNTLIKANATVEQLKLSLRELNQRGNRFRGSKGDAGVRGAPGFFGLKGADGAPGPAGIIGVPGFPGFKGISGLHGLPGFKGETGNHGFPGLNGMIGLHGLPGSKGETGRPGPGLHGVMGMIGPPGLSGSKGEIGRPGFPGRNGMIGVPGRPGLKGDNGRPGFHDIEGFAGLPGLPGPSDR